MKLLVLHNSQTPCNHVTQNELPLLSSSDAKSLDEEGIIVLF
ncbi:MAG: hypothetical protein WC121_14045 [Candidatus Kapaibacterium sp.]